MPVIALSLVFILLFPLSAYAYIDPGAGSMAYQALLALVLGAGFMARQMLGRFLIAARDLFRRKSSTPAGPKE